MLIETRLGSTRLTAFPINGRPTEAADIHTHTHTYINVTWSMESDVRNEIYGCNNFQVDAFSPSFRAYRVEGRQPVIHITYDRLPTLRSIGTI